MLQCIYNYGGVMKNNLYEELYDLERKYENLKTNLDIDYFNRRRRTFCFNELKKTRQEIQKVKFKIKIQELSDEKSR